MLKTEFLKMNPIRELVLQSGKTVVDVSREAGISKQTLHSLIKGVQKNPRMTTIYQLSVYFKIDSAELYNRYINFIQQENTSNYSA